MSWSSSESFLPQVNGVTNSVRRVLEHLALEGHEAELVAPTGPASYAGFPVHTTRGASLPFYRDFRIGLETRARLRAEMLRFRPDVVHIASPATLGLQAARAAEELGIPSVAIYQTDLIGFAERYAKPGLGAGGIRAMAYLTRRIHTLVDRTLAPSTASMRQLEDARRYRGWRCGRAVSTSTASTRGFATRGSGGSSPRTAGCWSGTSAGLLPRRSSSCSPTSPATPATRWWSSEGAPRRPGSGGCCPTRVSSGSCTAPSSAARTRPSTCSCTPVGTRPTASPPRRRWPPASPSSRRGPAARSTWSHDGVAGFLYEPGDGDDLGGTSTGSPATRSSGRRMGIAARRSVEGRSWYAVNEVLVEHYREVAATMTGYRELAA